MKKPKYTTYTLIYFPPPPPNLKNYGDPETACEIYFISRKWNLF